MKLVAAWLCIDCDEVFDTGQRLTSFTRQCPSCCSVATWPIITWLNRRVNSEGTDRPRDDRPAQRAAGAE